MRQRDEGRDDAPPAAGRTGHRARLLACSTGLIVLPLAALALAGHLPTDTVAGDLSATELQTGAPATSSTLALGREAVPDPQRYDDPKGVAVVAVPTTTTTSTTAPPPTTEAPAPEPERAPAVQEDATPSSVPADPAPTTPPTTAAPAPPPTAPAPAGSVSANLDAIARCESGGNPDAYNPSGYYGAFQFSLATWWGLGFSGDPRDYTYAEQKYGAVHLVARTGSYSSWPHCAASLGLL